MNFKKSVVIYLILVIIVFLIGSWSYKEVAINNRPLSPDEQVLLNEPPVVTQTPSQALRKFESQDSIISFEYPAEWLEAPDKNTITADGVNVTVTITNLIAKDKQSPLIDCDMKAVICEELKINGQDFGVSESVLNTGFIHKTITTNLKNKKVLVTALISTGEKQNENKAKVDTLINSIKVQN